MQSSESKDHYLAAIYFIQKEKSEVLSIDVAEFLRVSKPSVSRAIRVLAEEGLLSIDPDRARWLTAKGAAQAELVNERCWALSSFLTLFLKVDPDVATYDAGRMGHMMSQQTLEKIKEALASGKLPV